MNSSYVHWVIKQGADFILRQGTECTDGILALIDVLCHPTEAFAVALSLQHAAHEHF